MTFDSRLLSGIEVLAAVVEAGSYVRAGETLGLTQSGVSRAVARLETRVGVRLFDRTARAIALTEEGRSFYQQVKPHLSGIEDAAIQAAGSAVAVRGRLRVNVDPFLPVSCWRRASANSWRPIRSYRWRSWGGTGSATSSPTASMPPCASASPSHLPRRPALARNQGANLCRSSLSGQARSSRAPARARAPRMHSLP